MKRFHMFLFIGLLSLIIFMSQIHAQTVWTKHPGNPVLARGQSGEWDDAWVSWPSVIHDSTQFVMYYTGFPDVSPEQDHCQQALVRMQRYYPCSHHQLQ